MPGMMVLIRMPSFIRSRAIGKVIPTIPALDALYAAWPICPSCAATEAVFTITPLSLPSIAGNVIIPAAALAMQRKLPIRLTRMVRSNLSIG